MIESSQRMLTALWVCLPATCDAAAMPSGVAVEQTDSGRRALSTLRMLPFDLVVAGMTLPDMTPWEFIAAMRARWPRQRWALLAPELPPGGEVMARTMGVMAIVETPYDLALCHASLRPPTSTNGAANVWITPVLNVDAESVVG